MAMKISDIAKELGIESKDLRKKMEELKLGVSPKASSIKDDIGYMILDKVRRSTPESGKPVSGTLSHVQSSRVVVEPASSQSTNKPAKEKPEPKSTAPTTGNKTQKKPVETKKMTETVKSENKEQPKKAVVIATERVSKTGKVTTRRQGEQPEPQKPAAPSVQKIEVVRRVDVQQKPRQNSNNSNNRNQNRTPDTRDTRNRQQPNSRNTRPDDKKPEQKQAQNNNGRNNNTERRDPARRPENRPAQSGQQQQNNNNNRQPQNRERSNQGGSSGQQNTFSSQNNNRNNQNNSQNRKKKGKQGEPEKGSTLYFAEARKKKARAEEDFKKANRGKTKTQIRKEQREERKETAVREAVTLPSSMTVGEFANMIGISIGQVMTVMIQEGMMLTINDVIDYETAYLLAGVLDIEVSGQEVIESAEYTLNDLVLDKESESYEKLGLRAPIISVMGHVDHGKTSLLDAIREANVADKEAGGITQHIGAYQVSKNGKKITFLDTPGHEAFTSMRAQGAKTADIAVLVVAANDSVMPQTIEALNHAKAAGVPILVAINKIDLPDASPDKVKADLAEYDLVAEDWGGKTIMVPVSAKTRQGLDDLLEMILLLADVENLRSSEQGEAAATVIESNKDSNLGPVASVIINTGTLRVGQSFVLGGTAGKVRVMINDRGQKVLKAGPSTPVRIAGLSEVPRVGDVIRTMPDEKSARELALRIHQERKAKDFAEKQVSAREMAKMISEGKKKTLDLIIKADTEGSLAAIKQSFGKIHSDRVALKIIHQWVGPINDSDILMAKASNAMLLTFHVKNNALQIQFADQNGVEIREYDIIYKMIEDVEAVLRGLLGPEQEEFECGRAKVLAVFTHGKKQMIAGVRVTQGYIKKGCKLSMLRQDETVSPATIKEIRIFQDIVEKAQDEAECGVTLERYQQECQVGDIFIVTDMREIQNTVEYRV